MKVSKEILELVPYKAGKPISEAQREYGLKTVIKLASNENPFGISEKVRLAIAEALSDLHRYPDPSSHDLIQVVSHQWALPPNQIAVGNGSNEIIDLLIRIFCSPGESILTTQAAFLAYQICAQAARVHTQFLPLKPDYSMDLDAIAQHLRLEPRSAAVRIVFIPNPNNPTGTYVGRQAVRRLLDEFARFEDILFVFDEAYSEFVRAEDCESALNYVGQYSNVAVIRTLSKAYGLAGLRVGVLAAQPEVIELFNRVRNPFNVNSLAQVAAVAALKDKEFVERTVQNNWDGLDYFYQELKKMNLSFVESQGNFVMFDTGQDARIVNELLLRRGLILRPVGNYGFKQHLRMSIGLPSENRFAIDCLKQTLAELNHQPQD